jgi:UDP-N-acetylmuramyl pentapeptide phosphotransferase/UDP-N-acetylglucosamine-1-phosphate transferase
MALLLAAAVTAFVVAFLVIPVIIRYAHERNLMDVPGHRKIHKKLTPSLGGVAIFLGFVAAVLIWLEPTRWSEIRYLVVAQGFIFFVGLRDDLVPLSPYSKMAGQVLASAILILFMDLRLHSFHGIFGIHELPLWFSYGFTLFTFIVITNSFNLIDGLDGLAGLLAVISFTALGVWFFLAGDMPFALLAFSLIGAIVAFLLYNWEPSKIFMGDTGSLVLGYSLAAFTIRFIDTHTILMPDSSVRFASAASAGIAVLMVPLADTLRVFIIRVMKRQSPFKADKNHIHHSLLRLGLSHGRTTLFLGALQGAFVLLAVALRNFSNAVALPVLVLPAVVLSLWLDYLLRRKVT